MSDYSNDTYLVKSYSKPHQQPTRCLTRKISSRKVCHSQPEYTIQVHTGCLQSSPEQSAPFLSCLADSM